jgi:protein-disulfide isomerase
VLVEFFDYACGYCRASMGDIAKLLAEDKKLKVVYREMPVLGEHSVEAARVSLIAAQQNKYMVFHKAIFNAGRPTEAIVNAALDKAGVDKVAAKEASKSADVEAEITRNLDLQRALQLSGTPSWVVGDKVLVGAVGYDTLKAAIAEARKTRG